MDCDVTETAVRPTPAGCLLGCTGKTRATRTLCSPAHATPSGGRSRGRIS